MAKKIASIISGTVVGLALCLSSTAASAAALPVASISPFVALSAFGTFQSRSALCASAVGSAGVSAAAAAGQVPTQGCVLPVVDPAVAPVIEAPVAVAPTIAPAIVAPGLGFGIGALLAGLVLAAGLAAVLLSDNNNGRLPISPD